jgi:hypothetical protein
MPCPTPRSFWSYTQRLVADLREELATLELRFRRHRRRCSAVIVGLAVAFVVTAAHDALEPEALPPAVVYFNPSESPIIASDGVDWDPSGVVIGALRVPEKPPEWQETRCEARRDEKSINGGCYVKAARPPPCAEGQFEHDQQCWVAVGKRTRPVTTITE